MQASTVSNAVAGYSISRDIFRDANNQPLHIDIERTTICNNYLDYQQRHFGTKDGVFEIDQPISDANEAYWA